MIDERLQELYQLAAKQHYQVLIERDTLDLIPLEEGANPSDSATVRFDEKGIQAAIQWLKKRSAR